MGPSGEGKSGERLGLYTHVEWGREASGGDGSMARLGKLIYVWLAVSR